MNSTTAGETTDHVWTSTAALKQNLGWGGGGVEQTTNSLKFDFYSSGAFRVQTNIEHWRWSFLRINQDIIKIPKCQNTGFLNPRCKNHQKCISANIIINTTNNESLSKQADLNELIKTNQPTKWSFLLEGFLLLLLCFLFL